MQTWNSPRVAKLHVDSEIRSCGAVKGLINVMMIVTLLTVISDVMRRRHKEVSLPIGMFDERESIKNLFCCSYFRYLRFHESTMTRISNDPAIKFIIRWSCCWWRVWEIVSFFSAFVSLALKRFFALIWSDGRFQMQRQRALSRSAWRNEFLLNASDTVIVGTHRRSIVGVMETEMNNKSENMSAGDLRFQFRSD